MSLLVPEVKYGGGGGDWKMWHFGEACIQRGYQRKQVRPCVCARHFTVLIYFMCTLAGLMISAYSQSFVLATLTRN